MTPTNLTELEQYLDTMHFRNLHETFGVDNSNLETLRLDIRQALTQLIEQTRLEEEPIDERDSYPEINRKEGKNQAVLAQDTKITNVLK